MSLWAVFWFLAALVVIVKGWDAADWLRARRRD